MCVCVCKTESVAQRRGQGEVLKSSYHKKAGFQTGPIMTTTRSRFHGDDAGMMLAAY